AQGLFRAPVGGGDEIGRSLERYLQMLDLAEVALECATRFARGLDHDVEESRAEHGDRASDGMKGACVGLPAAGGGVKCAVRGRGEATRWTGARPWWRRRWFRRSAHA